MAGTGPAPKDPAKRARRNATVPMTTLPGGGRKGRTPAWPLAADSVLESQIFQAKRELADIDDEIGWTTTARDRAAQRRKRTRVKKKLGELEALKKYSSAGEREIWAQLWKTPQAVQWEKRGWFRDVALYARLQAKGEAGDLNSAKEARMKEDRLGLNDLALLKLHWTIGETETSSGTGTRAPARRGARKKATGSRARRGPLFAVPDTD